MKQQMKHSRNSDLLFLQFRSIIAGVTVWLRSVEGLSYRCRWPGGKGVYTISCSLILQCQPIDMALPHPFLAFPSFALRVGGILSIVAAPILLAFSQIFLLLLLLLISFWLTRGATICLKEVLPGIWGYDLSLVLLDWQLHKKIKFRHEYNEYFIFFMSQQ